MDDSDEIEARIKRILKQVSGNIRNSDGPLVPDVAIKGHGDVFCYSPAKKRYIPITRGLKAYIIIEEKDELGKILIYTFMGHIVEIDHDELIYTGSD